MDNAFTQSFDARDWAKAFCERFPQMDEGTMIGWFANALMRGFDQSRRLLGRLGGGVMSFLKAFREGWEERYPQYQTRWLAYCSATQNDPAHWTGHEFIIWIDKMLIRYGRGLLLDQDQEAFSAFIWQEVYQKAALAGASEQTREVKP